ncbi:Kelch repeat and BTB domain-containing 5, partial [Hyphodiscus hymeniophilus]
MCTKPRNILTSNFTNALHLKFDFEMTSPVVASLRNSWLSTMYSSGKYCDLTIKCQDRKFKVHRVVVCSQSKPLAAAVDGELKEAFLGVIDLEDDEPEVVANMIHFLYHASYDDGRARAVCEGVTTSCTTQIAVSDLNSDSSAASDTSQLFGSYHSLDFPTNYRLTTPSAFESSAGGSVLMNAKVYVAADKYDIPTLKREAQKKQEEVLDRGWNSASFVTSLKVLYEGTMDTDRALRDITMKFVGKHAKELMDRGEFVSLVREDNEICFDVLKASLAAAPGTTPPLAASSIMLHYLGKRKTADMSSIIVDPEAEVLSPRLQRQAMLLETGKWSDLSIICHGKTFKLHRSIVCVQSKPLEAMADGKFMEGINGVITLNDDDLDVFECLVSFFYKETYDDSHNVTTTLAVPSSMNDSFVGTSQALLLNAKVYVMAEKFDIPELKKLATVKYEAAVPIDWNSEAMAASINVVYEETPQSDRSLKEVMIKAAGEHARYLLERSEFLSLCTQSNDVCLDLLKEVVASASKREVKDCPNCGADFY